MVRHALLVASCFWIYFQTCYSDGYPGMEACARKEKKIFARARRNCKKSFSSPPTEFSRASWRCDERVRPAMSSQIQELDNQHYVRFDRHAIAVAAIGDDCNKSFYLPRKHHSIWSTHKRSFSPSPADHIMLPPTARQQQHVCFDRH